MATAVPPPAQSVPHMARAVRMQATAPVPKLGGDHGRDPWGKDGEQISQRLQRKGGGVDLAQAPVQDVALDIHQEAPRECRGRRGLAGGGVKPRHAAAT